MADFQQRHYQAVAQILQDARVAHDDERGVCDTCADEAGGKVIDKIERQFTDLFRRDNINFNVGLFQQACKPGAKVTARKVK